MIQNKEKAMEFRIKQFEKFYFFLMKNAPEGYTPWFFPLENSGKNPSSDAILEINPDSKGSWHNESARLTKEQCIEHINQGYNIGISARTGDALIIGDLDNPLFLNQMPKETLTTKSRKRVGGHFFGWNKDGSAKINLPTDDGEIRSDNQYVVAPGSYVPFNLSNEKDKKAYEELTKETKEDELLGYYTINEAVELRPLSFQDMPQFFIDYQRKEDYENSQIKQVEEYKEFQGESKYSELFKLKVSDIIGLIPEKKRFGHPLHESDTDSNFCLSKDGKLGHCWRHLVSLNAVQYLCVIAGYKQCQEAGSPHKGRGFSKIKGDKKALDVAYNEAVKLGLIKEYKNPAAIFTAKGQAKQFNKVKPLFFDKSGMWWLWEQEEFKWKMVDEVDILNMIEEATGEDVITPKNRTIILNSLKQEGRKHIPKSIKKTWIQFKDILIDIISGEKIIVTPEYFVTNPIPWELNKENFETTPIMDKIFTEWVGEKYVKTLKEILAYSILPDYPINRLFCFIGGGLNGKSKFLELLRNFVGENNCCSTELDTLLSSRFEITRLHKKLVCIMGETNFNEMSKTSILKKLTGGDLIGFEYKNKTPFDEINYAKILIATNNLPTTTDKTIGFYRRWMIIDFPNQFSEKRDILADIPEEEYSCLALQCCSILKNIISTREFSNEGTIAERTEKYESKSNFLEKFIKESTEQDPNSFITKSDFFKKFSEWSKEHKFREMSEISVSSFMIKLGIESEKKYFNWMFDGKGGQMRVWLGIKWKE